MAATGCQGKSSWSSPSRVPSIPLVKVQVDQPRLPDYHCHIHRDRCVYSACLMPIWWEYWDSYGHAMLPAYTYPICSHESLSKPYKYHLKGFISWTCVWLSSSQRSSPLVFSLCLFYFFLPPFLEREEGCYWSFYPKCPCLISLMNPPSDPMKNTLIEVDSCQ